MDPAQRRLERLPAEIPFTGDKGLRLEDVAAGKCTVEEFVAQMTDEDLGAMYAYLMSLPPTRSATP